jgi:hypothetical protein
MRDEVAGLERLGAAVVRRYPDHTVMTDLEGNEFCVEARTRITAWQPARSASGTRRR